MQTCQCICSSFCQARCFGIVSSSMFGDFVKLDVLGVCQALCFDILSSPMFWDLVKHDGLGFGQARCFGILSSTMFWDFVKVDVLGFCQARCFGILPVAHVNPTIHWRWIRVGKWMRWMANPRRNEWKVMLPTDYPKSVSLIQKGNGGIRIARLKKLALLQNNERICR